MAQLLERAMQTAAAGSQIFHQDETLAKQIEQMIANLQPLADEYGVELATELAPEIKSLRSATLGPVLFNGLRNAVQACAAGQSSHRKVELSIRLDQSQQLRITISDTGPGLPGDLSIGRSEKIGGHGLGLQVCRKIINDLGGELELTNIPFNAGAVLRIRVPRQRLTGHG